MKTRSILMALAMLFALNTDVCAQGWLGKLKDKAVEKAKETIGKKDKTESEEAVAEEEKTDAVEQDKNPQAATTSDFKRGSVIMFEDDVTAEQVGEFPSKWDLLQGAAETKTLTMERLSTLIETSPLQIFCKVPCQCRRVRESMGEGTGESPDGMCIYMAMAADTMIRHGMGEQITKEEVYRILEQVRVYREIAVAAPKEAQDRVVAAMAADELLNIAGVKASIVLADGIEASEVLKKEIMKYLRGSLASYKRPKTIEFVSALPKTSSGKVRRTEIKEKDWDKGTKS